MYSICAEFYTQQDGVNYNPSIINRTFWENKVERRFVGTQTVRTLSLIEFKTWIDAIGM